MNKELFQEWKTHPITKEILSSIKEADEEVQSRSKLRDTVDKTAMQCARDEGFCEGVNAFAEFIEDMRLNAEAEDGV